MTLAIENLPADPEELRALLLAERATHAAELARARDQNERLRQIVRELQRARFGRHSEKLEPDQLNLALEDVEQAVAAGEAEEEQRDAGVKAARTARRRFNRGNLPPHLPRVELVIDAESKTCPCCGGAMHRIGEDTSERLDVIPAQFRVLVVRRPKYACRACGGAVVQTPAPARLIEGGLPTEALVAHVLVAKYADHCPLYRQAQIYARQGIQLDRSTLAHWVGRAAWLLTPVHARLFDILKTSPKLFADETTAPVLDPGRGRTKTGQLWAVARDDRPWGGTDPPGVAYTYAAGRGADHAVAMMKGFTGILQVDGAQKAAKQAFIWDSVVRGFGLRITPAGIKSYILQYRVVGGRARTSRRYTIGKHGSPWTPESARTEAERLLREVKAGRDPAAAKAAKSTASTIDELCDLYLAEGTTGKRASTLRVDKGRIARHIRPLLGRKRVEELTRADVERFLLDVQTGKTAIPQPEDDAERKPGSLPKGGSGVASQCVILLGTMMSFAVRRGLRPDNPAHGVKKPKTRKMERFLSENEIGALATGLRKYEVAGGNPHICAALRLLLLTGCRKSELLSVRWENVDLESASIVLPDSKTGRKVIYLNSAAVKMLLSTPRVEGNPHVIVGYRGRSHLINIDKAWREIRKTAGLASLRLHDLRHSFASVAAAGGMSLPIIGALLGHKETSTTARYAHLSADPLRAANELIGSRISSAMNRKRRSSRRIQRKSRATTRTYKGRLAI